MALVRSGPQAMTVSRARRCAVTRPPRAGASALVAAAATSRCSARLPSAGGPPSRSRRARMRRAVDCRPVRALTCRHCRRPTNRKRTRRGLDRPPLRACGRRCRPARDAATRDSAGLERDDANHRASAAAPRPKPRRAAATRRGGEDPGKTVPRTRVVPHRYQVNCTSLAEGVPDRPARRSVVAGRVRPPGARAAIACARRRPPAARDRNHRGPHSAARHARQPAPRAASSRKNSSSRR